MSGRIAARDAIRRAAREAAHRHSTMRRGTVLGTTPLVVELHGYAHLLTETNDLYLSHWVKLYDHVVGIEEHDMVLVQQEGSDWVVADVVSGKDSATAFDDWKGT